MAKKTRFNFKSRKSINMLCMNTDPENSKWGMYAPPGGCTVVVENVDSNATRVLCSNCTSRAVNNSRIYLQD